MERLNWELKLYDDNYRLMESKWKIKITTKEGIKIAEIEKIYVDDVLRLLDIYTKGGQDDRNKNR